MNKHTKGPWKVGRALSSGQECIVGDGDSVVALMPDVTMGCTFNAHDARLIAAAPMLLEACQTFAEWLRREEAGSADQPWKDKRDTVDGERAWREWYYENVRICDLAQEQAKAAIAAATGDSSHE